MLIIIFFDLESSKSLKKNCYYSVKIFLPQKRFFYYTINYNHILINKIFYS